MIVGRKSEISFLKSMLKTSRAEFLAVYGRRRIGKTFLVRQVFKNEAYYVEAVGKKDAGLHEQISLFLASISRVFFNNAPLKQFSNWHETFEFITELFLAVKPNKKIVLFLDELPWMATQKSGLIQALDHFWNRHWSQMINLKLIVCGSAASWMLENLINEKGGLHNRITETLRLKPFTLSKAGALLKQRGFNYSAKQVLDLYLILGGVPFYYDKLKKSFSLVQNINFLCFSEDAFLQTEFDRLFKALFKNSQESMAIIRVIADHRYGISRDVLLHKLDRSSGGGISRRIEELEAAGFIQTFIPFGKKGRDQYYRVIDEYSYFYLTWIEPALKAGKKYAPDYWQKICTSPSVLSWTGYAFEIICVKHADKIRKALGLDSVASFYANWRAPKGSEMKGAQIDLIIERTDNAVTICEIKYSKSKYVISRDYALEVLHKRDRFKHVLSQETEVFIAFITVAGLKRNAWFNEIVDQEVLLDDLLN